MESAENMSVVLAPSQCMHLFNSNSWGKADVCNPNYFMATRNKLEDPLEFSNNSNRSSEGFLGDMM